MPAPGVLSRRVPLVVLTAFLCATALAQQPAITPQATVDQNAIEKGQVPLPKLLRSGQRFFTTPYQPYNAAAKAGDGYGEGPVFDPAKGTFTAQTPVLQPNGTYSAAGPRWEEKSVFYRGVQVGWPFLRLNGLDSQSCFECHNSIGNYDVPASQGGGTTRKPGAVGGSAGSNSNAYINPAFPTALTYLVRNPPHVFGTGYTQTLADEMTAELQILVAAARRAAQAKPNTKTTLPLTAKGLSFGTFATTFTGTGSPGTLVNCMDSCDPGTLTPYTPPKGFVDDMAQVTGVSCDVVVRPFQWKGIASSIRHFVRDALDFHFSMQAVEKYGPLDCDLDGKRDEMTLGNVSALTSFVTMSRPPQQANMTDPSVVRGRDFFTKNCTTCHVPSMPVYSAQLFIDDPGPAAMEPGDCQAHPFVNSLTAPNDAEDAPYLSRLGQLVQTAGPNPSVTAGLPCPRPGSKGFCIDLTNVPPGVPEHVLPRLPRVNGVITVPLFSDLRTHDMGPNLADIDLNGLPQNQPTDVAGLCITSRYFVTRPLWGVRDTGPWLHDGRALTLADAVLMHGGEAQTAADAFKGLSGSGRQDVVNFLLSLYLPCMNSFNCPPPPPPSVVAAADTE
jgi:Di-haem oxidoreductase, putative peroxidase